MKKLIQKWLGVDTLTLMDVFITKEVFGFVIREMQEDIKNLKKQLK